MPEIMHNFTGGKMNKDLDERLVPNGQYRDALNIKVSTSEGSDVGTVQNLLGNSMVAGQGFIPNNAVCVGSVSDEKNDKLYYFITTNKNIIRNGNFLQDANNNGIVDYWYLNPTSGWLWDGNKIVGTDVQAYNKINQTLSSSTGANLPLGSVTVGKNITIKFTISSYKKGQLNTKVLNENGEGVSFNITDPANQTYTFTGTVGDYSTTSQQDRFYIQRIGGSGPSFTGNISNVSVFLNGGYDAIIEHDLKGNVISPVLVDTNSNVLKFNSDQIITGINVIDGLLLWTDNNNEPKKINIANSITGTDQNGTTHTSFLNDSRGISVPIEEKHITVIKKGPTSAPMLELQSTTASTPGTVSTGVMRITTEPTTVMQIGADNFDNESSLWVGDSNVPQNHNHFYDFSWANIGRVFETQIETDINGNSGFTLDWAVGDTVVFREFDGNDFDVVPEIPVKDYRIKAKIIASNWNNGNSFTDQPALITPNSDFSTPNSDGSKPKYWDWTSSGIVYHNVQNRLDLTNVGTVGWGSQGVAGSTNINFKENTTYQVSVTTSNVTSGKVLVYIIGDNTNFPNITTSGNIPYWYRGGNTAVWIETSGTFNFNITTDQANSHDGHNYGNTNLSQLQNGYGGVDLSGKILLRVDADSNNDLFNGRIDEVKITELNTTNANIRCQITAVNNPPVAPDSLGEIKYVVDKFNNQEKLYTLKFPRFAYRYQYQDGEYSPISPFSQIAFLPGSFDYHPQKGYNLGMTNRVTQIKLSKLTTDIPDGVTSIDILYKDDSSPSIYIVDTIRKENLNIQSGNPWLNDEYIVKSEQINSMIPSNQLLRLWDAVPKKALAQDIVGNRIVYANYNQGFDLKVGNKNYYPDFNFDIEHYSNSSFLPLKSIKTLREYQVGVVFVDEYGRETPVVSNKTAVHKLEKSESSKSNRFNISFHNDMHPDGMKYFKFFVKETSGQYYNLAMDRWYNAEDDQVWLSFPSSERNKVDIESFLILKKSTEDNQAVHEEAKYKILDIKNEAPNFIKQNKFLIDEVTHNSSNTITDIFGTSITDAPTQGKSSFKMNYEPFKSGTSGNLDSAIKKRNLYIEFGDGTGNFSKRYRIAEANKPQSTGTEVYNIKLVKQLGTDVNFITNSPNGVNATLINNGTVVNIYDYIKEDAAKFDGRFFVKISTNNVFLKNITEQSKYTTTTYAPIISKKLYYLSPNNTELHKSSLTGQFHGVYNDGVDGKPTYPAANDSDFTGSFGRFAPFFRNYKYAPSEGSAWVYGFTNTSSDAQRPFGQYRFDAFDEDGESNNWFKELAFYTVIPENPSGSNQNFNGPSRTSVNNDFANLDPAEPPFVKVADKAGNADYSALSDEERFGEFNDKDEQVKGDVWFIDGGPYAYTTPNDNLDWGNTQATGAALGKGIDISHPNYAVLDIGIGGVYKEDFIVGSPLGNPSMASQYYQGSGAVYNAPAITDYFDVGIENNSNINYIGNSFKKLVNRIYPGQKFRFREDPTGEVYTIQSNVIPSRRIRWQIPSLPFPSTYNSNASWTNGWFTETNWTEHSTQLSPNFSKNWNPRFVNSSGTGTVTWNPIGDGTPGPIENGLEIPINHSSSSPGVDANTNSVYARVDTLEGVDVVTNEKHSIVVGMILVSHSDAGDILDGSAGDGSDEPLAIKEIEEMADGSYKLHLTGYTKMLFSSDDLPVAGDKKHNIFAAPPDVGEAMVFKQPKMNGYSQYSVNRLNAQHNGSADNVGIMAIGYNLDFLQPISDEVEFPSNPAVWETEPKEITELDIYYEASGLNPVKITEETKYLAVPLGSGISHEENPNSIAGGSTVRGIDLFDGSSQSPGQITAALAGTVSNYYLTIDPPSLGEEALVGGQYITVGDKLSILKPDSSVVKVTVTGWMYEGLSNFVTGNTFSANRTQYIFISENLYGPDTSYGLNWHNCYSFGNGVESNRIKDTFNLPFILNGAKVSTTVDEGVGEEFRKNGLIYSGIYNSTSSVNNLNQFIAAEKITKDLNPTYGSIQKIHTRDADLIALCEDKVLRILAQKDALFNADGNPQLTSTNRVLGQAMPFVGEYGISTNPESFASESYRIYFADKTRGSVMRLSKDGLTAISNHGMSDWFRDNLALNNKIIGSYDSRDKEYNVTLPDTDTTVSFDEKVRGWVSFKSFVSEQALSCANNYYTVKEGKLWKHYEESVDRNNFYSNPYNSSVNVLLNDNPSVIKSFFTLSYEGSQSKIDQNLEDNDYYNLQDKKGWYVTDVITNKQKGSLNEFIEKEGKWFNYIKGLNYDIDTDTDIGAFDIQGIGFLKQTIAGYSQALEYKNSTGTSNSTTTIQYYGWDYINNVMEFNNELNVSVSVGDDVYYCEADDINNSGGFNNANLSNVKKFGRIIQKTNNTIKVAEVDSTYYLTGSGSINSSTLDPTYGAFILFSKNKLINKSGLNGYFADVKFENNSTEKIELFTVGSEVSQSSQ